MNYYGIVDLKGCQMLSEGVAAAATDPLDVIKVIS